VNSLRYIDEEEEEDDVNDLSYLEININNDD